MRRPLVDGTLTVLLTDIEESTYLTVRLGDTGVTFLTTALAGKRLELIREVLLTVSAIGFLLKPNNPASEAEAADAKAAALAIGLELQVLEATGERAIDVAFTTLAQRRAGALLVGSDPFFGNSPGKLVELAARHAVPTMYFSREFVEAGGLMSYGSSQTDAYMSSPTRPNSRIQNQGGADDRQVRRALPDKRRQSQVARGWPLETGASCNHRVSRHGLPQPMVQLA